MKLKQIIKYGLITLGAATLFACATPQKQKVEYSQPTKQVYSEPVKQVEIPQPVKQDACGEYACNRDVVPYTKPKQRPLTVENLAECLANKGAVLYGAEGCSHCQDQKAMFGNQIKNIRFVECASDEGYMKCQSKGIQSYPTWVINGQHYKGTKSLEQLSDIAGCNLW